MYVEVTIYREDDSPVYIVGEVTIQAGTRGSGYPENSVPDYVSTIISSATDEEGNPVELNSQEREDALDALNVAAYDL